VRNSGVKVYNNWFHDYDLVAIHQVVQKAGFSIIDSWNDLSGSPCSEGGEWIAIVAKRNN